MCDGGGTKDKGAGCPIKDVEDDRRGKAAGCDGDRAARGGGGCRWGESERCVVAEDQIFLLPILLLTVNISTGKLPHIAVHSQMKTHHEELPFRSVLLFPDMRNGPLPILISGLGRFIHNEEISETFLGMYKCDGNGH